MRLVRPEPDRAYLQAMEVIKYIIDDIEKALRLRTDDPDPRGFAPCVRQTELLHKLMKNAAINQERKEHPIFLVPERGDINES